MKAVRLAGKILPFCLSLAAASPATAVAGTPLSFSLQGRLMNETGTAPITGTVTFLIDVYSPDGNCLLYEETRPGVNLSGSDGKFAFAVGTPTGDPTRTANDPGLSMLQIFNNGGVAIRAPGANCAAGYTPAARDVRGIRITVTEGANPPVTLAPDQAISSVPYALVAETLQGLGAADFVRIASTTSQDLGSGGVTTTGNVGIGLTNPTVPLDVVGNTKLTGNVTVAGSGTYTGTWAVASDARFKREIRDLEGALGKVLALRGVSYELRTERFPERRFESGRHLGFIAQEVEAVIPEVVRTGADGYKSVAYQNLVPVLVEALKESEARQEKERSRLRALEAEQLRLRRQVDALRGAICELGADRKPALCSGIKSE